MPAVGRVAYRRRECQTDGAAKEAYKMSTWTEHHDRAAEIVAEDFPAFACLDDPDVHEARHGREGECDCADEGAWLDLVDRAADGLASVEAL